MPTFNKNAKILVDALAEQLDEGKRAIEISEYIALCTLDIICGTCCKQIILNICSHHCLFENTTFVTNFSSLSTETAMGESIHAQRERESDYVEAVKS